MSEFDWYPHNIPAYDADTRHLTCLQHGAYRLLIDEYYRHRRPLVDIDQALANICHLSLQDWLEIRSVIRAFFRVRGGWLHLKRADAELDRQDMLSHRRSEKAKKAALIRHRGINGLDATSMGQAKAKHARAMLGDATGTETERDLSVPASESSSESESSLPAAASPPLTPENQLSQVQAIWNSPSLVHFGRIKTWVGQGADFAEDILPTLQAITARKRQRDPQWEPRGLNYFDQAIADVIAARTAPMPEGKPNGANGSGHVNGGAKSQFHDRFGNFDASSYLKWRDAQKGEPQ